MASLNICLLGPFSATFQDQPIQNFKTVKVQALFIYLAMERDRNHRREKLMDLLWPEMPLDSAQVNLRQTIYRLRQAFLELNTDEEVKIPIIVSDRNSVSLNPELNVKTDVNTFLALVNEDPVTAIQHYRGDFLADFYLVDSNQFETWSESIREQLRRTALEALNTLTVKAIEGGDTGNAQAYAWRQLEIDRFQESAYQQLMIALAQSGQRTAALAQFQICQERLKEEMGIDPCQETVEIYEHIQADVLRRTKIPKSKPRLKSVGKQPTFVLTDIEASTRLWDTYHQAMLPALLKHNTILENLITEHGGRILELRGDGVKAVFEGINPLQCMLDIQKSLNITDWGEIGDLKIRIGLHGVPAVRKGYDYFQENDAYYGPVLNHTARIMDAGWGGQILVSDQVRNSCSLPEGASWEDYGLHKVKSLDQPIHIFGLLHPELPTQFFPPLRTLTTQRAVESQDTSLLNNNLPPQQQLFIGRQKELSALETLLRKPQNQLVTIVGPGGIGKTSLVIALAQNQIENCQKPDFKCLYPDGVFFIPLVSINDPNQIIPTIAKILKIHLESSQAPETLEKISETSVTPKEKLANYLHSKRVLIILDNFEHLMAGVGIISDLLYTLNSTQFIATSRERLHIREEQIFPIQGLEFPDWEAPEDPCEYTAMELFLQSARRVKPEFNLEPGDMVFLTRICRLVEGMPLGLELAASWVDMLSLEDITFEIQTSLDFLETDIRNIPDRHRSVRAVFDSSWSRLSESEKFIFPRLSVFRGDFSRNAANEVAQASIRSLANFVGKSLLQFNKETNRYHIHELLRQYGVEQLSANPLDEKETFNRYSNYYCNRIKRYFHQILDGDIQMQIALDRMGSFANIQVAWNWAITHGIIDNVDKALDGICLYYNLNMRIEEGLNICKNATEMLSNWIESTDTPIDNESINKPKRLYARILSWQAFFNIHYDHDEARQLLKQSQIIIQELAEKGVDTQFEEIWNLYFQALLDFLAANLENSKAKLQQGLTMSKTSRINFMVFQCLSMLGDIARISGNPREARSWYRESLEESRAQNNRWGEIMALNDLGWAARSMMAYDEARYYYEESYSRSKSFNAQWEMVGALLSLGWLSLFLGDLDKAVDNLSQAAQISQEMEMPHRVISAQVNLGIAYWLSGDFDQAEKLIRDSLALSKDMDPGTRLFPTICMAEFYTLMGQYPEAKDQAHFMNSLTQEIYVDRFLEGRQLRVMGYIALADKDYTTAADYFRKSIEACQFQYDDEQIAWSQAGLARALIGQGNWEESHQLLTEALWTAIEIKGFIPLVFIMPVVVLYLAHEDPEQAIHLLNQLQVSRFITDARFFTDIVYQYLPKTMKAIPITDSITNYSEILWDTAASVLSKWIHLWMEEPENAESKPSRLDMAF